MSPGRSNDIGTPSWVARSRTWAWVPVLLLCLAVVGISWALSSPIGSSPDDDFHLGSIWCSRMAPDELCEPSTKSTENLEDEVVAGLNNGSKLVRVPALVGPPALCFAFDATSSGRCQDSVSPAAVAESRANAGLYPGGYYEVMGALVSSSARQSVILVRFVSYCIAVALIVGAAAVARPALRRSYSLAVLATSIPLGVFLFASTNPSGISIAAVGAAFCCALGFLTACSRREMTWPSIVGIAAIVCGLSARADTGLYIAVACGCAFILARGWRHDLRTRSAALAVCALLSILWLGLSGQTSSATDGIAVNDHAWPLSTLLWNNLTNLPSLWLGSLGWGWGLGWLDTRVPDAASASMVLVLGALIFWGLGDMRATKLTAALLVVATVSIIPMWLLATDRRLVGELVQPRYLLPMLPVLITTLLLPARRADRTFSVAQVIAFVSAVSVAHSLSLHANLRRYVTGQEARGFNLDANVEWWWEPVPSPMVIWSLGSVAFAVCVVLIVRRCLTVTSTDCETESVMPAESAGPTPPTPGPWLVQDTADDGLPSTSTS